MAFAAAAAVVTPVPRMFSSEPGASYAGRLCIPLPTPTPCYSRLSTITHSSSQLAFALSLVPKSRSSPRPWLLASALQEGPAVGGGKAEGSKSLGAEVNEATGGETQRRTLCAVNLPWDIAAADIEALFAQCGTVEKVEKWKSRGFAFVRMGSDEEAKAAIDKLDSLEVRERIIRVKYAKNTKRPSPSPAPAKKPSPPGPAPVPIGETRHLIYVSNLAWKVRSNNLRKFFSANFKPASAQVVFDSSTGWSTGYGFVSFATAEEAEAAVSELNGKELMGRPLRLKISEKKSDKSSDKEEQASTTGGLVEV